MRDATVSRAKGRPGHGSWGGPTQYSPTESSWFTAPGGFPSLCNKVPGDPILHPNNWTQHSTCAEKVSHEKEKAQLTLYNGFFKTLHIFVTL